MTGIQWIWGGSGDECDSSFTLPLVVDTAGSLTATTATGVNIIKLKNRSARIVFWLELTVSMRRRLDSMAGGEDEVEHWLAELSAFVRQ